MNGDQSNLDYTTIYKMTAFTFAEAIVALYESPQAMENLRPTAYEFAKIFLDEHKLIGDKLDTLVKTKTGK